MRSSATWYQNNASDASDSVVFVLLQPAAALHLCAAANWILRRRRLKAIVLGGGA